MSTTTTFDYAIAKTLVRPDRAPRKSFWQKFMEARERQGAARVRATFRSMSNEQLADIGLREDQVRYVRERGIMPLDFWA
ncbi:MAG: hypothetical protein ACK5JT_05395 [Hyphomicrobiaceae bacterium]